MTDHIDIIRLWGQLAVNAARIVPTKIPLEPMPSDIRAVLDDLDVLCDLVDPLVEAIAANVQASSGYRICPKLMKDQLRKALDGQLLWEIEQAAEHVQQQLYESVA